MRTNRRLILASGSPRRRELLANAGFEFEVVNPAITEISSPVLTLREITLGNAMRKALAVARADIGRPILAADTLVELDGEVIGKPVDLRDAMTILRRLSGRTHNVCSAVIIWQRKRITAFHEISRVRFRRLSEGAIRKYVKKIDPLDKAGAYAAQQGAEVVERVDGSLTNVVGLPMEKTIVALRSFGIEPTRIGT